MGMWDWLRPRKRTDEPTAAQLLDQVGPPAPATRTAMPVAVPSPPLTSAPRAVFAVLDVETTGLAAARDRVLELSVVRCDAAGRPIDEWSSRFNPQGPVGATHIHGITAADVADAPLFAAEVATLAGRLSGLVLVAHNARFDLGFLRAEFARAGWAMPWAPSLCTLEESRRHLPSLARRRLPDCCAAAGVRHEGAHSALGDARAAAGLLAAYLGTRRGGAALYDALVAEAAAVAWPDGPTGAVVPAAPARVVREDRRIREQPREHRRLVQLLDDLAVADAVPTGAPEGTASYVELLAEVLEDGVLTDDEAGALADIAQLWELPPEAVTAAHEAFLLALAGKAVADARVTQAERAELYEVAELLGVDRSRVLASLDAAAARRDARQSEGLAPLPEGWAHGEPLRVGESVVFTGCDEDVRTVLEARAKAAGLRVSTKVSGRTAMLVTDGSFAGTKLADAQRLGTRIVAPELFGVLLDHVQPAAAPTVTATRHGRATPSAPAPAVERVVAARADVAPAVIREWARGQGIVVSDRGRLSADVVARYHDAHPVEVTP
ncbi:exonuclease domain-containing protein [Cellulomonas sp. Y8]|uniref:exonuclease domain-containing protein n=1 Tax=Cellulomonas sp. Y8 TaxID=2591145 RepID=UPI003D76382C